MKLAASNIAWPAEDDARVGDVMASLGFTGLEVAPTRLWSRPLEATAAEIRALRRAWERKGIRIAAMQALLFGRPDLTIFGADGKREETRRHLEGMIDLGAALGAGVLVFGSPKNRSVAGVDAATVDAIGRAFFRAVGDYAAARGVCLCIEPNPPRYGCDYVTDIAGAMALVERVGSPGFGLHVDAGCMSLNGEPIEATLSRAVPMARHFHISEADLVPVGSGTVDHRRMADALVASSYDRWVSVEMRTPEGPDPFDRLRASLEVAAGNYGAE